MLFNGSLATWMSEQRGLLALYQVAAIIRQTAEALQQLHAQRIVHNDVNPTNIVMRFDDAHFEALDVRLSDQGTTARAMTRYSRGFPVNSQPIYMAPEQWNGRPVLATDQYALAVLAYELFTGIPPFQGPPARLLDAHVNARPPAPSTLHQRVSPAHDTVLLAALSKRAEDRFPSVSAFAYALEQSIRHPESMIVEVPSTTIDGNLRATLPVSMAEATLGTLRTVLLPQRRRITVTVPEGANDGQIIRLEKLAEPSSAGASAGDVLLTVEIGQTDIYLPVIGVDKPVALTPLSIERPTTLPPIRLEGQVTQPPASEKQTSGGIPIIGSPRQTKVLPFTASLREGPRSIATSLYSSFNSLPPRRRRVTFVSVIAVLLLILIVGSVSLFALANSGTPIPYGHATGSLALNDILHDNTKGYNWPDGVSSDGGSCQFVRGAYHVSMTKPGSFHYCIAGSTGFGNFAYEARMVILNGDEGGLVFRADGNNGKFYYFRIGRDGSYGLYLYGNGSTAQTLTSGLAPAIRTGLNIANLLAVVAHNSTIDLYVNQQHIASVNDSTYSYGQIGVAAAYETGLTEVSFSNMRVWTM